MKRRTSAIFFKLLSQMARTQRFGLLLAGVLLLMSFCGQAQHGPSDTSWSRSFALDNVVESNVGIYHTTFDFVNPHHTRDYRLVANSSGYFGAYLSYKWFSFNYSLAIPGTQLDAHVKLQDLSLRYRFVNKRMMFEPFLDAYNGLLIPKGRRKQFDAFRDFQNRDVGFDYYYFTNANHFSFRASYSFSALQKKSAGAFFVMATPKWQQLHWSRPNRHVIKDSTTYGLLLSNPQWLSFVGRIGYAYNLVLANGRWMVAPSVMAGGGGLQQINRRRLHLEEVTDLQASLSAGFNGNTCYFYVNGSWEKLQTDLTVKHMTQINTDCSLTAGWRFGNAKSKILATL